MQFWPPLIRAPPPMSIVEALEDPSPQPDQPESSQVSSVSTISTLTSSCQKQPSEGSVAIKSVAAMKSVIFTAALETDIVEWIKDHLELYDKKLTAYRDTASKGCLWTKKSVELNTKCQHMQTWYSSM